MMDFESCFVRQGTAVADHLVRPARPHDVEEDQVPAAHFVSVVVVAAVKTVCVDHERRQDERCQKRECLVRQKAASNSADALTPAATED